MFVGRRDTGRERERERETETETETERGQISIMFSDVVGFTSLSSRMDADRVRPVCVCL